jgi:hypothetical protein
MNFLKTLLSLFALFFTFQATAQSEFQRKNLNDEYSWNNSTREERNEYYFNLKPINSSKSLYHFRYQKSNQIVDLFSENGIEFNGQILNIVQENKDVKTNYGTDSKAYNYLFEPKVIRDSIATRAGQYILNTKAYTIPTDTLIKNWNSNWLDCNGIDFNYKVKATIYTKSYSCPWNQIDSVAHVIELKTLRDTLNEIIDLEKSYSFFKDQLPKGKSYTVNGWINMYIMTDKEYDSWKKAKPIRDFQKSIKDTIDDYLKTELNRLIPNSKELKCYDDYWLTFSKKGRLTKMNVNMGFWERLADKDYKKCRRILKKAFRKIRIDFIDPKYTFYRGLTFGQKEIYITDPTIY